MAAGSGSPSAIRAGEAFIEFGANDKGLMAAMNRLELKFRRTMGLLARTQGGMGAALSQGGAALMQGIATVGRAAVASGVALTPVLSTYLSFDDAIRAVGARTEATADQFARLRARALELGRTSGYTATEVAKLMNVLGTSGFTPDQVSAMAGPTLNLARAGSADPATAAQGLADAIKVFKLSAEDATSVADKFSVAANKSAIDLTGLAETFQYVAPVAAEFGMSLDKALALSAALGDLGIRGSEAGTALRRMQVLLGANEADLNRLFGVSGRDAAGELRPVIDVIGDIQESLKGLSGGQRIEKLNEFFGLLGITSAAGLGNSLATVRQIEAALADAGGTAERTAAQMDAGIGGAWRRMRGAAESAAISIGEAMGPALAAAAALIQGVLTGVTQWIAENRELAVRIGAVVVGLLALGAAGLAILGMVAAVKVLAVALGLLVNPYVWLAVLAGVLIEKWVRTTETGKIMAAEIGRLFQRMAETVGAAVDGIMAALKLGDVRGAWQVALLGLEALWYDFVASLLDPFHHFTNLFRDAWRNVLEWVRTAWAKTQAWMATKLIATAELFIIPVLEASDLVGATEGKADKMKAEFKGYKDTIAQMRDEEVKAISREMEADKGATLDRQAAERKGFRDSAEGLRGQIGEITARMVREAVAVDVVGGAVGGAATLTASPELGGRKGDPLGAKAEQLGLAVQGVYQSADFAGAFGRGRGENQNQTKQLKEVETINKWLEKIWNKIQPGVFQ